MAKDNTGNWNTGDRNTGDLNTGNWNTGNWNTGDLNTGDLNTTQPKTVRIFNIEIDWEFRGELHIKLKNILWRYQKPLCEWISKCNMTDKEIKDNPTCETTEGYLKVNDSMRNDTEIAKEDREFLLAVPNFNNEILKECTGIDLEDEKVKIIIDKKEIWISKESAENLKKAFIEKG